MLTLRLPLQGFVLGVALTCGCALGESFEPPLRAENEHLALSVHKFNYGGGRIRIWATLRNKTKLFARLSYGQFVLEVGDRCSGLGALIIGKHVNTGKLKILPRRTKTMRPLQADGVSTAPEASLVLRGVRVPGSKTKLVEPLRVTFPFDPED